jgi:hypothetical protein
MESKLSLACTSEVNRGTAAFNTACSSHNTARDDRIEAKLPEFVMKAQAREQTPSCPGLDRKGDLLSDTRRR